MKTFSRLRTILIIVLSVIFLVALTQTVCVLLDRKQANDAYKDLQNLVVVEETNSSETDPSANLAGKVPGCCCVALL